MEIQTTEIKEVKEKKTRSKPKQCPLKHSNFFFTINSNKNMSSMGSDEYNATLSKFKEVIGEFYNVELKNFIIMQGSKMGTEYGLSKDVSREELEKRIVEAKCEFVVEIGEQSHKLHSHGLLALSKRGLDTKIDYNKVREWLEQKLGYTCHFNNQLYRDAKKNLQAYISKAPIL